MIPSKLIKHVAENTHMLLGQQVHVNHEGCNAGVDTKKRLYIKKVPGGLLAFCHHCREAGFVKDGSVDGQRLRKWLYDKPKGDVIRIEKAGCVPTSMPIDNPAILTWLNSNGVYPQIAESNPDVHALKDAQNFKELSGCLYLPLRNCEGFSYGYQLRDFTGDLGSKYKTYYFSNSGDGTCWFYKERNAKHLIITEDYTSAYRACKDVPNCDSLALLKTSITTETIDSIRRKDYEWISVWLDPDAAGIAASKKVVERLKYILPCHIKIIEITCKEIDEPKRGTKEWIPAIIERIHKFSDGET